MPSKTVIFLDGPMEKKVMACMPGIRELKMVDCGRVCLFGSRPNQQLGLAGQREYRYQINLIASGYPKGQGKELYGARLV